MRSLFACRWARYADAFVAIGFVLSAAGCKSEPPLLSSPKHFVGSFFDQTDGKFTNHPISADSTPFPKQRKVEIRVQDLADPSRNRKFQITFKPSGDLEWVEMGDGLNPMIEITLLQTQLSGENSSCFISNRLHTCISKTGITFTKEIENKEDKRFLENPPETPPPPRYEQLWVLNQASEQALPALEPPASYSVKALMRHSVLRNFEARLQFEHVIAAKALAKGAYDGLLPHLTVGDVWAFLSPNMFGLLGVLADLAPFLLPDRWIRAEERSIFAHAQSEALFLMKVNAASLTEDLGHALSRDTRILSELEKERENILAYRESVRMSESERKIPVGATNDMDLLLNHLDQVANVLEQTLNGERRALSQATGFFNPDAILSVIDEEPRCDRADLPFGGDPTRVREFSFKQSIELQQMDELIRVSQLQKKEYYFNWIDPSTSFNENDGLTSGSKIAVNEAHTMELQIQKQQLQANLLQKTDEALDTFNSALRQSQLAQSALGTVKQRLSQILETLETGSGFSSLSLTQAIQESLRNTTALITAKTDCQASVGRLNRLMLQGLYAEVEVPVK